MLSSNRVRSASSGLPSALTIVVVIGCFLLPRTMYSDTPGEPAPVVDFDEFHGPLPMPTTTKEKASPAAPTHAGDVLVVCPPTFSEAIQPWIRYRQDQGYRITMVAAQASPGEQLELLRRAAALHRARHVVLVGDTHLVPVVDPIVRQSIVPSFAVPAKITAELGSEPEIGTDHPYSDLNGDGMPEVAVGRISVDTAGQLSRVLRKVIQYENSAKSAPWRRRVNFVAGTGGFGPISDALIETSAKKIITDEIPAEFRATMTYGSWRSPYCPSLRDFRVTTLRRLNEGSLFWVYMGHGRLERLARVRVQDKVTPVFEADDHQFVNCVNGNPIAVLLACYTGAFDHNIDCLAEELVRNPGGPVAAIAGSRMTMPYGMAVMGMDLLDCYFNKRPATLGEVFLFAKQQLIAPDADLGKNRKLLDTIARAASPSKHNLAGERSEHALLFNLFGDPLLQLHYPSQVQLAAPEAAIAGSTIRVQGHSPISGRCHVELVCRRDRTTTAPQRRLRLDLSEENLQKMNETYRAVNDDRWTHFASPVKQGRFRFSLPIPSAAHGPSHVRVFVHGREEHALGATDIYIRQPTAEKKSTKLR